jgi:hypothetical protein
MGRAAAAGRGAPLGERAKKDGRAGAITVKADGFGTELSVRPELCCEAALREAAAQRASSNDDRLPIA